ncbi:MAG TPA: hypothetical protein VGC41_02970 [Kofleriaceae bacterium]
MTAPIEWPDADLCLVDDPGDRGRAELIHHGANVLRAKLELRSVDRCVHAVE